MNWVVGWNAQKRELRSRTQKKVVQGPDRVGAATKGKGARLRRRPLHRVFVGQIG
jgi:hypothetical protein